MNMADLILWAIIESLKADGYEAREVKQSAGDSKP